GMWVDNVWHYFFFAFLLMVIDYITGILAARVNEGLQSGKATKGLFKKVGIVTLLVFGFLLDEVFHHFIAEGFNFDMPFNMPIGLVISAWVVITEGISICENLERLGVPIPKWLVSVLRKTQNKIDNKSNEKQEDKNNEST
ncbi:MAG: phage holin family protein, partial [Oscillospiraceae bacterium]|nr:phage holin family protein [Oscillospiraceae bacterium]